MDDEVCRLCGMELCGEVVFDPADPRSPERVHARCAERLDLVEVTVWVLVDQDGRAVADCNIDHVGDEYRCDVGDLEPGTATQLYRLKIRVARPKPMEINVGFPRGVADLTLNIT